jgi:hypothetical protein
MEESGHNRVHIDLLPVEEALVSIRQEVGWLQSYEDVMENKILVTA